MMSDIHLFQFYFSELFEDTSIVSTLSINTAHWISKGKNGICKMNYLKLQLKTDLEKLVVYIFLFSYRGR